MNSLLILSFVILFSLVKGQDFKTINSDNVLQYLQNSNIIPSNSTSSSFVLQQGDNNHVELYLINDDVVAQQLGNSNVIYYNDSGNLPATMKINMVGDQNNVEVVGSNSISNGMTIDIIGNGKTIQIENQ